MKRQVDRTTRSARNNPRICRLFSHADHLPIGTAPKKAPTLRPPPPRLGPFGSAFTGVLANNGIAISMDGKGAWRDNVFVERLWRSVKYEEVYLRAYESVGEARNSIGRYLDFYNRASEHPSGYVIDKKRFCWLGWDPAGYLGFCRARSVMDRAADVVRAARAKIQGPSDRGWIDSISPASAASRSVLGATFRICAALPRLSQGFRGLEHRDLVVRAH